MRRRARCAAALLAAAALVGVPVPAGAAVPIGASGAWRLAFDDEFSGTTVGSKWSFRSSAEALWCSSPYGTSNPGNQQLEFDRPRNATVANGLLTVTARPESVNACGRHYNWTSAMLNTSPSYPFRYGFVEVRARLPYPRGYWPGFWTWQAPGVNAWVETDVFEYYSDNHTRLYLSQHSGAGGGCVYRPPFDPSTGMHVYGADIEPTGTDFFVDGRRVCHAAGTSTGLTNINFVYSRIPPSLGSVGRLTVDYVRGWQR